MADSSLVALSREVKEVWRQVVRYEGMYEVSSLGRFKRVAQGRGAVVGRFLSTRRRNKKGYIVIELCIGDVKRRFLAHQLVARAFIGPPPTSHHVINHKDSNKTNNQVDNLEWLTRPENNAHAKEHGLLRPCRGVDNGRAKLSEDQIKEIISMKGIVGARVIASRFGVARSMIQRIHQGKAWQCVREMPTTEAAR